jgi:hypothetical protein
MKVIVLCETSNKVAQSFRDKGHEVYSLDILPNDVDQTWHIQADLKEMFSERPSKWDGWWKQFDMCIAHPPCTYLCNSGVRWLYNKDGSRNLDRWLDMLTASGFFYHIQDLPIKKIVIENPIPHKYGIGQTKYDQIIQPWQHGHGETKATCLWLKGVPKLVPSNVVEGRAGRMHKLPPSKDRWKIRSETYQGIANAMADQWG